MVQKNLVEDVQIAVGERLAKTTIGSPRQEGVRMGALAGQDQMKEVKDQVELLMKESEIVFETWIR